MRLWTIHPSYLDSSGLTALWREGLLARKVLLGQTKGYKNHPQLNRFINHPEPLKSINCYLFIVWQESLRRGFSYDCSKISKINLEEIKPISVTTGQILHEFLHLKKKLKKRSPNVFKEIENNKRIITHPIFNPIPGPIESWEKIS